MGFIDIIKLWPKIPALAQDIDMPTKTVQKWKERDYIPPKYWLILIEAAKKRRFRGVTLKHLAELAAQ